MVCRCVSRLNNKNIISSKILFILNPQFSIAKFLYCNIAKRCTTPICNFFCERWITRSCKYFFYIFTHIFVGEQGLEPRLPGPKPGVLPIRRLPKLYNWIYTVSRVVGTEESFCFLRSNFCRKYSKHSRTRTRQTGVYCT